MSRFRSTHCFRPTTQSADAPRGASTFVCLGVAAVSLFSAGLAHADPRLTGGARVAITASDVSGEQEYDPRFGAGAGVYLQGRAWKSIDLRVEAIYAQKGARLAFGESQVEWQMDYLEVPMLVVFNLMPKSRTSVELFAGAAYGFGINRQIEVGDDVGYNLDDYIGNNIDINPTTTLSMESVEKSDIGFALGMGLSVPTGPVNFLVDVRYVTGLTDPVVSGTYTIQSGEGAQATYETAPVDFANRCFSFSVGFAFPFGARSAPEPE